MKVLDTCQVNDKLTVVTIEREIDGAVFWLHVALQKNFDGKTSVGLCVTERAKDSGKPLTPDKRKRSD